MEFSRGKLLSLLAVPLSAAVFAEASSEAGAFLVGGLSPLPGLVLIWFGEHLTEWFDVLTVRPSRPTPGCLIEALGWILLIGFPVMILILSQSP